MGDPLIGLREHINWEAFRKDLAVIGNKLRRSNAGAPPFDCVFMLKILILQQLNNLSDDKTEFMIRDRLTYQRFLAIEPGDRIPDAKTIWVFRNTLKTFKLHDKLFESFNHQLSSLGCKATQGQLIDSTFVEAPKQRNTREENIKIKAGETPEAWNASNNKAMFRQKDIDATWTKKNNQNYYGYKNHINVDQEFKLIQSYKVTTASVHDSQVFEVLLDQIVDGEGYKRPVYADSVYRSEACETMLTEAKIPSQVRERKYKGTVLTEEQMVSNKEKSKVRARVEHVFGSQAIMNMHVIRTIGLARAEVGICLRNLTYNMVRFLQIIHNKEVNNEALA